MYTIYSDMDGVLVDFERGVVQSTGRHFDENNKEQYQHVKGFWENMPPMPDFDMYWNYIKKYNPHILTAYPDWDVAGATRGKKFWNNKYLHVPESKLHIVARKNKKLYAVNKETGKPNILIDDFAKNIKEWKEAGGIGILHTNALSTISQLKHLGIK